MGCERVLPGVLPTGESVLASFHLHLEPLPRDVSNARRFVREHAPDDLPAGTLDVLLLLTSELVTNAVLHARTVIELGLTISEASVLVTVHDQAVTPPAQRPPEERDGGRGLDLVRSLASASDMSLHTGDGKTAWFLLPRYDEVRMQPLTEDEAPSAGCLP